MDIYSFEWIALLKYKLFFNINNSASIPSVVDGNTGQGTFSDENFFF
jgi:hypothetical protein